MIELDMYISVIPLAISSIKSGGIEIPKRRFFYRDSGPVHSPILQGFWFYRGIGLACRGWLDLDFIDQVDDRDMPTSVVSFLIP